MIHTYTLDNLHQGFASLELHISASASERLPGSKLGKALLAAGGRYSACRGYSYTRFVHVPTAAPKWVIQALFDMLPSTAILRAPSAHHAALHGALEAYALHSSQREPMVTFPRATAAAAPTGEERLDRLLAAAAAGTDTDNVANVGAERAALARRQAEAAEARRLELALHAAAPELLAALREALNAFSHDDEGPVWADSTIAKARAAIAKAEGREPLATEDVRRAVAVAFGNAFA